MPVPLQHGSYLPERGVVAVDGEEVRLTGTERRLLDYLVARPGQVVGYEELLVEVWKAHPHGSLRPIESTLARLRKRLGESGRAPVHLHTEYGEGIRFVPVVPTVTAATEAAAATEAGVLLGTTPWSPTQALAWLREQEGVAVPLTALLAQVGAHPVLLGQAVALGRALTRRALPLLDPLAMAVEGRSVAEHLEQAWSLLDAPRRALLQAVAAFAGPVDPAELAQVVQQPLLHALHDIQGLLSSGWLYREGESIGIDVAFAGWLASQPGRAHAEAAHRAFLRSVEDLATSWRWFDDLQLARLRDPSWRPTASLPGEVWLTDVLGADPAAHPVDRGLLQATSLYLTNRLDEAVDVFESLAPPDGPEVLLRWCIVGAELAAHVGDLVWHRELQELGREALCGASAALRYQFACNDLELAHLCGGDLSPAKDAALAAAAELGSTARAGFAESLFLHYRFQEQPSVAVLERQRALVQPGSTDPSDHMLVHLLVAERELGQPLSRTIDDARRRIGHPHGYLDTEVGFLLQLALASLPDLAEVTRLLTLVPKGQHASNQLRRAVLEHVVFGRTEGLAQQGGAAMVERARRLQAGDADALPGEGWYALRHLLRAPRDG